jgi:hypothetical protein
MALIAAIMRKAFKNDVNAGPQVAHLAEVKLARPGDEQARARGDVA